MALQYVKIFQDANFYGTTVMTNTGYQISEDLQ